jgi:expansin (peptidoglycan-binding protein)
MHFSFIFFGVLCIAQVFSQTSGTGKITWYTQIDSGKCSFGTISGDKQIAALNTAFFANGATCGSCYNITGPLGSTVVRVTDECPVSGNELWCSGDHNHFDLSTFAFNKLALDNCAVTYTKVACPVTGPIRWVIKEGSNKYWFGILVDNHKIQLSKLSIRVSSSSNWISLSRSAYNYWICDSCISGGVSGSLQIQLTGENGEVLTDSISPSTTWPLSTNTPSKVVYSGTVQFGQTNVANVPTSYASSSVPKTSVATTSSPASSITPGTSSSGTTGSVVTTGSSVTTGSGVTGNSRCSATWECSSFSKDYNFVDCVNGKCVCKTSFAGSAVPGDVCRCDAPKQVFWNGGIPSCGFSSSGLKKGEEVIGVQEDHSSVLALPVTLFSILLFLL